MWRIFDMLQKKKDISQLIKILLLWAVDGLLLEI